MTFEKGKLFFDFEQRINFEVAPYFFLKITIMEIRKEKKINMFNYLSREIKIKEPKCLK